MIDIDDIINRRSAKTATTEQVVAEMQKVMTDLVEQVNQLLTLQKQLLTHIEYQDDRIRLLDGLITDMAPDLDLLETIAETDEEKRAMVREYMNLNTAVIDEYIP